jgi:hypothetical protein
LISGKRRHRIDRSLRADRGNHGYRKGTAEIHR